LQILKIRSDLVDATAEDRVTLRHFSKKFMIHTSELIGIVHFPLFHELFEPVNRGNKSYQFFKQNPNAKTEEGKTKPRLVKKTTLKLLDEKTHANGGIISSQTDPEEQNQVKVTIILEW
jgi:hypothetical protein